MSASAVSRPKSDIKDNEDKTKIFKPMFSGSNKNVLSFYSRDASAAPKISASGFGKLLVIFPHDIRVIQAKIM